MKSSGAKCLIKVANDERLICRQLRIIRAVFPHARVTVVIGFEADRVIKHISGVQTVYNDCFEYTNTAYSVALGMAAAPARRTLVIYGDIVFDKKTLRQINLEKPGVLCDPVANATEGNAHNARAGEVGVTAEDGLVSNFAFGLQQLWSHIFWLGTDRDIFVEMAKENSRSKQLSCEFLNDIIEMGGRLTCATGHVPVREIDTLSDIEHARGLK